MPRRKVLVVFGTRPEAIKLAPVIGALRPFTTVRVCVTAQHREMLDQVLPAFAITPDIDLDLMRPGQDLFDTTSGVLLALRQVLAAERPDLLVVQGDTTTTMAASLAAFYARVPVVHVEAGLRSHDLSQPFPEEMNRRVATVLAALHCAPTAGARAHLVAEGVPAERIVVTGNTAIDALLQVAGRLQRGELTARVPAAVEQACAGRRLILVTGHRRESFGAGMQNICVALRGLVDRHPDVVIVYPVHLNPNVRTPVHKALAGVERIVLTDPLPYVPFVALMQRAEFLLTDSGGIQEEGPSLGKPVLVMREKTERPEGVAAGLATLVGTDPVRIADAVDGLLARPSGARQGTTNPYRDGQAAARIAAAVCDVLGVE